MTTRWEKRHPKPTVTATTATPSPSDATTTRAPETTDASVTATSAPTTTATSASTTTASAGGGSTESVTGAGYGGTTGWSLVRDVDLTKEPVGTRYTNGVRTNTDQSFNRKEQASYGANGLTVTAERASSTSTIYSADVQMRGIDVPDVGAIEVDIDLQGTGAGLGHAFWFRPLTAGANGEMDLLEYIGSNAGNGDAGPGRYESKATLIRTGTSPYNQGSKAHGIEPRSNGTYNGLRRYRYEFTKAAVSLWVDGELAGSITKEIFEKQNGTGSWSQFQAGTHWYPRVTLQVNNGTNAKLWGTVPTTWRSSSIRVAALRIYGR
ncbi:hypothetical protein E8D34_13885 [Nocardioides sp. GY 10113]|nr:hypothetical protein E8D34_13885 [Nocardioides sp. GY 10113]